MDFKDMFIPIFLGFSILSPDFFLQSSGFRAMPGSVIRLPNGDSYGRPFDPTRVTQISWRPRAFLYRNFLTDKECDHLIKVAKDKLEKSMVADTKSGKSVESKVRTSSGMFLRKAQDEVVAGIESRISVWTFLPVENGEAMQILHYENGQKYEPHWDYFHDKMNQAVGGHRIATVLMYLSNVEKGGETVFPQSEVKESQPKADEDWSECARKGYSVKPVKGDALLFFSLHPNATIDPLSLHGSCPVIEGEKWSATKWIHVRSFSHRRSKRQGCRDENAECPSWAARGECEKNPVYMLGNCRKSEQFRSSSPCGACSNSANETATSGPHSNNFFIGNPKLASIKIGSKEPEFCRNGYTHRIRAIERNLVDGKHISEDKPAQDLCIKKELIQNVDAKSSGRCVPSSIDADNKDMNTDPKKSLGRDEKVSETNKQGECTLRRSIRKRKVRCLDEISSLFKSRTPVSRCKKNSGNTSLKLDERKYKYKSAGEMNEMIVPISPSTNASEESKDDELPGPLHIYAVENTGLLNESEVEKHEVAAKESTEHTGGSDCSNDKNRLLKYTFSRKRKKNLSSKSDNCYNPGKSFLSWKMGEKSSFSTEKEKTSLIEDQSGDSQNMVEVACQLISLSEERSW